VREARGQEGDGRPVRQQQPLPDPGIDTDCLVLHVLSIPGLLNLYRIADSVMHFTFAVEEV
jgi:hypothetical protein